MYILSLETSGTISSVALHHAGKMIAAGELHIDQSHSQYLSTQIAQLLALAGIAMSELAAIAISAGPGSFTGLRIGISMAKGLCMALDIPMIAISTLAAMSLATHSTHAKADCYVSMLDARRDEVYLGIYNANLEPRLEQPLILAEETLLNELAGQVVASGSGAAKLAKLAFPFTESWYFLPDLYPTAQFVGALAWQSFELGQFEDLAYFEANYLKEGNSRT